MILADMEVETNVQSLEGSVWSEEATAEPRAPPLIIREMTGE